MTRVLTINAGSSSLKLDVVERGDGVIAHKTFDEWDGGDLPIRRILAEYAVDAIGHRIVHGGWRLSGPVLVDDEVTEAIADAIPLAPVHQERCLAGVDAARRAAPRLPSVACFDTTFHNTTPTEAATYAIPREWRESYGIVRFGFHGLSHAYIGRRAAEIAGRDPTRTRTVSCHLGSGASVCAIENGRSVDTTMGFTPLDGIVMGKRSGSIDPGILLWLLSEKRLTPEQLDDGLRNEAGLLALTGTSDMKSAVESDDPAIHEGLGVYQHSLVAAIASMAASMNGLDVLAFTGGVGANSPWVREDAARRLEFLGVAIDPLRNAGAAPDCDIADDAGLPTLVIAAGEEFELARATRSVLDLAP